MKTAEITLTAFPSEWKQLSDGDLLDKAEQLGYDALITSDKNMRLQQEFRRRSIALLVLPTNRSQDLLASADEIGAELKQLGKGEIRMLASGKRSLGPR